LSFDWAANGNGFCFEIDELALRDLGRAVHISIGSQSAPSQGNKHSPY